MLLHEFYDDLYPNTGFYKSRKTVRALVFNDKGELGMMHVKATDIFGERDHFETPGGGIEHHEDRMLALHREIEEELGYTCIIDDYLGLVINRYNLIGVITAHHFFVCHLDKKTSANWTDEEKFFFEGVVWKTPEEWIDVFTEEVTKVNKLVHERELFMIQYYLDQQGK